ncbi:MAG: hypothetical protein K5696_05820 [Lachnospiraceae bacterium]|nr:hypothetical protein [Lachnospiraceae bacterium]
MKAKSEKKKRVKREIVRSKNRLLKGKDLFWLRLISFGILGAFIVAGVVAAGLLIRQNTGESTQQTEMFDEEVQQETAEIISEVLHEGMLTGAVSAGEGVREALEERPEEIVLSGSEASEFATVDEVRIADAAAVSVSVTSPGLLASDDKYYYLFEEKIWQEGTDQEQEQEPLARQYKDSEVHFLVDLNRGTKASRLFSRFYVAVKQNGAWQAVSHARYIDNPEALASYQYSGRNHSSKKGLLIDPLKTSTNEWDDLGVQYCTYNFPLAHILGATSNGAYPTITYNYHGKTWYFNGAHIHQYDYLFSTLTNKGIDITAILLNNASVSAYPDFTHPSARSGSTAPYYMFNGVTEDGVEALGAVASFLASRYSGGAYGRVQNWIIGNEVNARKEWNYMASGTGIETYTAAYAKAYRVFYNAIKAVNGGAGVYICFDQQWDRNKSGNPDYDARDMLDLFAADIRAYGDIDWGLAYHPYSVPLTKAAFWQQNSLVTNSANTSFITMKNIGVLTSYMHQSQFLTRTGEVRSIILSEQGFTSTAGQEVQAAAFIYAYKIAAANPDIDIFIYARESDHASEIAENLALGLNDVGGGHKRIYQCYKHVDMPDSADVCDFALGIIGIGSWP